MRYNIVDDKGAVINTIIAEKTFMDANYPGRYVAVPEVALPVIRAPLSVLDFRNRFTHAEKVAIYTAAQSSVEMQVWLADLAAASEVNLSHDLTISGVNRLETAGLIGVGRAAQILGD